MTEIADVHVIVVGGGPSGLATATALRTRGVGHVTLIEREREFGGIPRHTDHLGFGLRDMHRVLPGPAYAGRLVAGAGAAGVNLRSSTTVIGTEGTSVRLATGEQIEGDALVLATGVRERPRAARLVAGDRPRGVFTTGTIQQLTSLQGLPVGRRAVIVGAEHVSFSAILTLRHAGCVPAAMVTSFAKHQTMPMLRLLTATRHRVPIITNADVAKIVGRDRVEHVVLTDGRSISCDTVVFTGDWIPDHELARSGGLTMTPIAKSPSVSAQFQSSRPGVFAVGNLVHPAETADVCALDGRRAAADVVEWLTGGSWPTKVAPIVVEPPISWAAHSSRGIVVRVNSFVTAKLQLEANGRIISTGRTRRLVPNRSLLARRTADPGSALVIRLVQ